MSKLDSNSVEVVIDGLATDGRGVAHIDAGACFVERALPGDRVRLELLPDFKPLAGRVLELLSPSVSRVEHTCPHAAECKGSLWGSLDYSVQLQHKRDLAQRTLHKMVGDVPLLPIVAAPRQWHYRNRISLSAWVEDDRLQLGYQTAPREWAGLDIHTCKLAVESVDAALHTLTEALAVPSDEEFGPAPLRIQLHQTASGAGALLLFARPLEARWRKQWDRFLQQAGLNGGAWYGSANRAGIADPRVPVLSGDHALPMITESNGLTVELHPAAFTQANAYAALLVENRVREIAAGIAPEAVWDLYGGYGALGFAAAGQSSKLNVIEISTFAESVFRSVAGRLGVSNTRFLQGDLLQLLPRHAAEIGPRDLIILDPPRSGAHAEVLKTLADSRTAHILYLSCNPARLARDLVLLRDAGFQLQEAQPYDFFPQTPATEILVYLSREL